MAFKDLTDFKSQYALHKNMQLLTEALTAVQIQQVSLSYPMGRVRQWETSLGN